MSLANTHKVFLVGEGLPETRMDFFGDKRLEKIPKLAMIPANGFSELRKHGKKEYFQTAGSIDILAKFKIPARWALRVSNLPDKDFEELVKDHEKYLAFSGIRSSEKFVYRDDVLILPHYHNTKSPLKTGGIIPQPLVKLMGLSEGACLHFRIIDNLFLIEGVDGLSDLSQYRNLLDKRNHLKKKHPRRMFPLQDYGAKEVQAMSLLAPIMFGSNFWVIGSGNSGKTYLNYQILEALAEFARQNPQERVFLIISFIGDRELDIETYEHLVEKYPEVHIEFYYAPWGLPNPDVYVETAVYALSRAIRLMLTGMHGVIATDSVARLISLHSSSSYIRDTGGGMISSGLYRESIVEFLPQVTGFHGWFDEFMSMTQIATVLANERGTTTAEAVVDREASDSATTGYARLVNLKMAPFPRLNVSESHHRIPPIVDPRPAAHAIEMDLVNKLMWRGKATKAEDALEFLASGWVVNNPVRFTKLPEKPSDLAEVKDCVRKLANQYNVGPEDIHETAVRLWKRMKMSPPIVIGKGVGKEVDSTPINPPCFDGERSVSYFTETYLDPSLENYVWDFAVEEALDPNFVYYRVVSWFADLLASFGPKEQFGEERQVGKGDSARPQFSKINVFDLQ